MPHILRYDRHIPPVRLAECIEKQRVYVLCDEKRLVGVLRYSLFWQTIPFLDLLYIDEHDRGKDHGRKMMAHWEARLQQMGYKYGMLSTQEDESAKYFYEKLGYGRIGAFLPPEQDAQEILYLKTLSG